MQNKFLNLLVMWLSLPFFYFFCLMSYIFFNPVFSYTLLFLQKFQFQIFTLSVLFTANFHGMVLSTRDVFCISFGMVCIIGKYIRMQTDATVRRGGYCPRIFVQRLRKTAIIMAGTRINTPPPTQYNVWNLTTASKCVERWVEPIPYKEDNSGQDVHINF
jgi:hypothetical protein